MCGCSTAGAAIGAARRSFFLFCFPTLTYYPKNPFLFWCVPFCSGGFSVRISGGLFSSHATSPQGLDFQKGLVLDTAGKGFGSWPSSTGLSLVKTFIGLFFFVLKSFPSVFLHLLVSLCSGCGSALISFPHMCLASISEAIFKLGFLFVPDPQNYKPLLRPNLVGLSVCCFLALEQMLSSVRRRPHHRCLAMSQTPPTDACSRRHGFPFF